MLDFLIFESKFSGKQSFELSLKNVERFSIVGVHVDDPLKVIKMNMKKSSWMKFFLRLLQTTFNL